MIKDGIAISLDHDVYLVPVLINSPPEIMALTLDVDEHFVQVPHVSQTTLATSEAPRILWSERPTPLPHGLVGHDDPPLREEFLDIAEAEGETVIQPDCVTDNDRRKPVAMVATRIRFHPRSLTGGCSS